MATPNNPAPVSGPGALSQRTDGGPADSQPIRSLPDAEYGANKEFREIQQGAPLFAQPEPPSAPSGLFAPTDRPDEPVTAGIASGPGAGPTPYPTFGEEEDGDVKAILQYMPALKRAASGRGAPDTFKTFVRYLETYIG